MAERINRSIAMIGYILTPEFSSKPDQLTGASGNQSTSQWRLIEIAKTSAWIFLSISVSLALGQLN